MELIVQKFYKISVIFIALFFLTSCGGENNNNNESQVKEPKTIEFVLTANDKMKFNLDKLVANEGDSVKIKLKNVGRMPKEVMGHNFVLLSPKVDPAQFATKALAAKENEYIPQEELDNIIVHSKLLGPGEEVLVEFVAPQKGIYKYICSFPGHYLSMQGTLIVR